MKFTLIITASVIVLFLSASPVKADNVDFVTVNGTHFEINGNPYYYTGTNFWYGLNLGSAGPGGDRNRLLRELDSFQAIGLNNLRIMAGSEGPNTEPWRMVPALQISPGVYDSNVLDGLDYLLSEMGKRNLRAVMCMNNFWQWSGGMAQYVNWNGGASPIPYPGNWDTFQKYAASFYSNSGAKQDFNDFIYFIVNRVNPYTGIAYKNDPTIMAWELANEPRGYDKVAAFRIWVDATAAYIKSLDSNHLVTTGSEGDTPYNVGNNFVIDHNGPDIDYTTIHIWPQNWGWFNPSSPSTYPSAETQAINYLRKHATMANVSLNKPLVLEEFGLARDNGSYDPCSATTYRNLFYGAMFEEVYSSVVDGNAAVGANFWAWAGEGRPLVPYGSTWSPGDPWIGDPPHENQGWYSVYDSDASTLNIISAYCADMYALGPIPGDINLDRDVDFADFALFAEHWRVSACGQCGGADLTGDSDVDSDDLALFADNWLMKR
jgi:mannan endo-1,4-beta-mannosidase